MYTSGIRDLRSNLATVLRRAASGESTMISDRGKPVAKIGPIDDSAPDLERLIWSGGIEAPHRSSRWRPGTPVRIWSGTRIDRALKDLRG